MMGFASFNPSYNSNSYRLRAGKFSRSLRATGRRQCSFKNRAILRKRDVNPRKTNFGTPAPILVHASRTILGARAMNAMLVVVLMSACAVNVACLLGHL